MRYVTFLPAEILPFSVSDPVLAPSSDLISATSGFHYIILGAGGRR